VPGSFRTAAQPDKPVETPAETAAVEPQNEGDA